MVSIYFVHDIVVREYFMSVLVSRNRLVATVIVEISDCVTNFFYEFHYVLTAVLFAEIKCFKMKIMCFLTVRIRQCLRYLLSI